MNFSALFTTHRATIIQFLKFGTVGALGFVLDRSLYFFGRDALGCGAYGSAYFSFPFVVAFTWIGNRLFTFRGQSTGSIHEQAMKFFAVCAVGLVLNRGTFSALTYMLPLVRDYPTLGLLAGTGAGMFFNFFLSRRLVFR